MTTEVTKVKRTTGTETFRDAKTVQVLASGVLIIEAEAATVLISPRDWVEVRTTREETP